MVKISLGLKLLKNCRFTKQAAVIAAFVLSITTLANPSTVNASIVNPSSPNCLCDLQKILENIIGTVIVPLAGIVLFIMLIVGGYQYLTSGGDPKGLEQGKKTLTYAIGGIALLVLAWFALWFIESFTGVNVTVFSIPCPPECP